LIYRFKKQDPLYEDLEKVKEEADTGISEAGLFAFLGNVVLPCLLLPPVPLLVV